MNRIRTNVNIRIKPAKSSDILSGFDFIEGAYLTCWPIYHKAIICSYFDCELTLESVPGISSKIWWRSILLKETTGAFLGVWNSGPKNYESDSLPTAPCCPCIQPLHNESVNLIFLGLLWVHYEQMYCMRVPISEYIYNKMAYEYVLLFLVNSCYRMHLTLKCNLKHQVNTFTLYLRMTTVQCNITVITRKYA